MTTLTKIIITTVLSLFLLSCQFNFGVKGNGNVTSTERTLDGFDQIEVSRGLDVFLTQGSTNSAVVEADENLQELITLTVKNGVLEITSEDNIASAKSKKVYVTFSKLNRLKATSGSEVVAKDQLQLADLEVVSSSGAEIELNLIANTVNSKASSGSELNLFGKAKTVYADASSGSELDLDKLSAETAYAEASSGSSVDVNATEEVSAKASSGGSISYSGNPKKVSKKDSSGGSISKD